MKLLFALVLLIQFAFATTYYVDASATGTANGTSRTNAWTSLSSIPANVSDGDTVLVYNGTYTTAMDWATSFSGGTYPYNISVYLIAMEAAVIHDLDGLSNSLGTLNVYMRGFKIKNRTDTAFKYYWESPDANSHGSVIMENCIFDLAWKIATLPYAVTLNNCFFVDPTTNVSINKVYHLTMLNVSFVGNFGGTTGFVRFQPGGTLTAENIVWDATNGTVPFLNTTYPPASATITNWLYKNMDITAIPGSHTNFRSADALAAFSGTFPQIVYTLGSGSPAIGSGTNGADIGFLGNFGAKFGE